MFTHCVWASDALYRDDVDRMLFVRELARAGAKAEWTLLEFCLMRSHFHLLVEVEDGALPLGMHSLNFRYAMAYNNRHAGRGHVMSARYGSRRLAEESALLTAFRYVARNPVEAGLCSTPTEWAWSSYAGTVGTAEPHSFVDASRVAGCYGEPREIAIARLRAFVEDS